MCREYCWLRTGCAWKFTRAVTTQGHCWEGLHLGDTVYAQVESSRGAGQGPLPSEPQPLHLEVSRVLAINLNFLLMACLTSFLATRPIILLPPLPILLESRLSFFKKINLSIFDGAGSSLLHGGFH